MPFYRIGEPGQDLVAHLNFGGAKATAKKAPKHCRQEPFEGDNPKHGDYCSRMAVALCDVTGCDAPICEGHRTIGATPNTDFCPEHAYLKDVRHAATGS